MARPNTEEDFDSLHEYVLQFMGAFSTVQFAIDGVIGIHLRCQMPNLGESLEKQFLRRVRDDQRLLLFKAFSLDVSYNGDLTQISPIYDRAKQVRDLIGHSLGVTGPVHSPGKPPSVTITRSSVKRTELVPDPLLPSTFTRLIADCDWIEQHVWRAGYMANPQMFVDIQGNPFEPPAPASLPVGGEPLT